MLFGSPGSWWLAKVKQPEPRRDSVPFVGCLGECDSHSVTSGLAPTPPLLRLSGTRHLSLRPPKYLAREP